VEARERWLCYQIQVLVIAILEAVTQADNPLGAASQTEEQSRFQNITLGANTALLSSTKRVGVAVQNELGRKMYRKKPRDEAEREPVAGTSRSAQTDV
jgi:hypothetical protein